MVAREEAQAFEPEAEDDDDEIFFEDSEGE